MLIADEPNVDFTLALGADTFMDLVNGKWRRSEDVLKLIEYRIVVFRRLAADADNEAYKKLKQTDDEVQECIAKLRQRLDLSTKNPAVIVTQIPTTAKSTSGVSVSSSATRNTTDEALLREVLTADVFDYIKERKMYAFSE
jgi:nicotinic acid mononucleotide adenylyltransferase